MKAHGANLPDGANLPAVPQSRTYFNLSRSLGLGSGLLTFSTDSATIQGCHIVPKSRGDDLVKAICGGNLQGG